MSEGPFRPRGPARPSGPAPPAAEPGPEASPSGRGPRRRPPAGRPAGVPPQATWIVGTIVVLVLGYITINTITSDGPGSRGVRPGTTLPPFAAPLATSDLNGDANVLVKASKGVPKACDVRGPDIVNSCQLAEAGPSVLAFLVTRSRECIDAVDALDRLRPRFPGVQFAAVAIRGDRGAVRQLVRRRGWELPVAYDRDGAVANAYAIAVCPTITFARRGGVVAHETLERQARRSSCAAWRR